MTFKPLEMNTPGFKLNMKTLFDYAYRVGASDLLITADAPPMVRVDGDLHPAVNFRLEPPHTKKLLWSIINETQQEMLERQRELDFSLSTSAQLRFRVNMYYQRGALAGAFRLIPNYIPKLEKLGLPPVVKEFALRQNGLILLTGPTGSENRPPWHRCSILLTIRADAISLPWRIPLNLSTKTSFRSLISGRFTRIRIRFAMH